VLPPQEENYAPRCSLPRRGRVREGVLAMPNL
jgi:hypothetical protein